ncbi:hypothetical protein F5888DRAFT_1704641 [Russula emetica]|nr:hypothetical protein F5888DRAFT_1704641 [Russula emetica]
MNVRPGSRIFFTLAVAPAVLQIGNFTHRKIAMKTGRFPYRTKTTECCYLAYHWGELCWMSVYSMALHIAFP